MYKNVLKRGKPIVTKIFVGITLIGITIAARYIGLPVSLTLGAEEQEKKAPEDIYVPRNRVYVRNRNNTHHSSTKAKEAISVIVRSCSNFNWDSELIEASNDIFEIVRDNDFEDSIAAEGISALEEIAKKAGWSNTKTTITDLIKKIAIG